MQIPNHIKETSTTVLDAIYSSKHPLTLEEITKFTGMDRGLSGPVGHVYVRRVLEILSNKNRIRIDHDPKTNINLYSPNPDFDSDSETSAK